MKLRSEGLFQLVQLERGGCWLNQVRELEDPRGQEELTYSPWLIRGKKMGPPMGLESSQTLRGLQRVGKEPTRERLC